jgi:methyl-accepting chemotaxis protein
LEALRELRPRGAASAEQSRQAAETGIETARHAAEAMVLVNESTTAVTNAIARLDYNSDAIGGIVATITGIADQTNLLALNAAIEAARAGEQGRGFAVVADEVRKLAEEAQSAAGQISELIREIQAETQATVTIVDEGAARTQDGVKTVEHARQAFASIGAQVEELASGITLITSSMSEVAAVAEQSSASSEQVSASTEQTSASAQEIAASAGALARTAEGLEQLVGQFRVAA